MESIITTLAWAAIIQGLFLVGLYFFSQKHRSFANRLLGLFLLVIVYEGTLAFLPFENILGYPEYYFTFPEVKLFYPVLFFHYTLEKVGRSEAYRKMLRIHYLLAFAVVGISLVNFLLILFTGRQLREMIGPENEELLFMIQQYYAFILVIVVFILAAVELKRYQQVVRRSYSDYQMLSINWLWRFLFALLPIILAWGMDLVRILLSNRDTYDYELVTWAFVIIFLYFVSFQAFQHKNLFEGVDRAAPEEEEEQQRDSGDPLSAEDQELIRQIRRHMETEEPYLDSSLSIYRLAQQLDIPTRELSLIINHQLNQHFFDFVNEYRIRKAMTLLADPENSKMTVLEILYEVGFNSKSSFNTVFKKFTGKTPTQYRKTSLPVSSR